MRIECYRHNGALRFQKYLCHPELIKFILIKTGVQIIYILTVCFSYSEACKWSIINYDLIDMCS